jgi:hypothetical protein
MREAFYIGKTANDLYAANVKEVTQITIGEPAQELFEIPQGYIERSPSQRRSEFARKYPEESIPQSLREADRQDDDVYFRRQADGGK